MSARAFVYRIVANGVATTSTITAATRGDALRRLMRDGAIVLELRPAARDAGVTASGVRADDAVLVLKQIAVMTRARVDLLEAIDTIASALADRSVATSLRATATALRQGERLAAALKAAAPFYPPYVYALISAGEASGRLPLVLDEAARQMAFDQRVARDIQNALVYPGFLVASGVTSVAFIFYAVVPRFAEMLRNARAELTGLSSFVIEVGMGFHNNAALVALTIGVAVFALWAFARTREGAAALSALAHATPGVRTLLLTRQRTAWSRIMALGLNAGVDVLDATTLAASALPDGNLKADTMAAIPALRAGRPVDEAFLKSNALTAVDASLIRAGQRSGALGEMFRAVADRNEEEMRDALKRFTLILEPAAIALVASMIGAIVLGLVSALAGIYESIG